MADLSGHQPGSVILGCPSGGITSRCQTLNVTRKPTLSPTSHPRHTQVVTTRCQTLNVTHGLRVPREVAGSGSDVSRTLTDETDANSELRFALGGVKNLGSGLYLIELSSVGGAPRGADSLARPPRLLAADATYHVMARGNNHQPIFDDNADREVFLTLLGDVVVHRAWAHTAFCLMGNHFHSVIRTPEPDLSGGMRDLLGKYALAFNRRHGRSGSLFGGRFHAVVIKSDEQLLEAIRYVAANPVRAGLLDRAEDWPWSSYSSLVAGERPAASLDVPELLALFHPVQKRALMVLRDFVREVEPDNGRGEALVSAGGPRPSPANLSLLMPINDATAAAVDLGFSQAQIAASLGLSRSSVAHRLRRVRRARGRRGEG